MNPGEATVPDDGWGGCNPLDPDFRAEPHARLSRLREVDPVNVTPIGIVRLLRYADCERLLKDIRCGVRTTAATPLQRRHSATARSMSSGCCRSLASSAG